MFVKEKGNKYIIRYDFMCFSFAVAFNKIPMKRTGL